MRKFEIMLPPRDMIWCISDSTDANSQMLGCLTTFLTTEFEYFNIQISCENWHNLSSLNSQALVGWKNVFGKINTYSLRRWLLAWAAADGSNTFWMRLVGSYLAHVRLNQTLKGFLGTEACQVLLLIRFWCE